MIVDRLSLSTDKNSLLLIQRTDTVRTKRPSKGRNESANLPQFGETGGTAHSNRAAQRHRQW